MNLPTEIKSVAILLASLVLLACSSPPKNPSSSNSPNSSRPTSGSSTTSNQTTATSPKPPTSTAKRPGGYYQDDGPGATPPPDLESIVDASPKLEPLSSRANRPYSVFGIQYIPLTQLKPYREKGMASWYGKKFHGQPTSIGERYDMYAMTAAHPTFPLPSYARVTNPRNGKVVIVRVNDRGPFLSNRIIDLSYTAAAKLGYVSAGSTEVEVELIDQPTQPWQVAAASASAVPPPATLPALSAPVIAEPSTQQTSPQAGTQAGVPSGTQAAAQAGTQNSTQSSTQTPSSNPSTASPASTPEPALVLTRETIIANQPNAPDPGLYLQIGAFSGRESAQATKLRLAQQFPWIASETSNKTDIWLRPEAGLFKLHLGPYATRQDASASIERLKNETGLQAFVVTR